MSRKQAAHQAPGATLSSLSFTPSLPQHPAGREGHSDIVFLQSWASGLNYSAASVLRAGQIRRANPELVRRITTAPRG
ncbi:hypothetical protein [Acetobacter papayae]|uniref:hypothetical protein n=1 Tax=Acetobacter papayae TaxID=1076592 RepID=UPI00046F93E1|nr:hypothetical protein [Acetobacter papayae]